MGGRIYARSGVYTVTLSEENAANVVDAQAVPPPGSAFKPNPRTHVAGGRLCPVVSSIALVSSAFDQSLLHRLHRSTGDQAAEKQGTKGFKVSTSKLQCAKYLLSKYGYCIQCIVWRTEIGRPGLT